MDVTAVDKEPLTARGRRTRERLVAAARQVFEEVGFLDARITDIVETAGVAHGTFYTYFSTKEEVFREVATLVQHEMLAEGSAERSTGDPARRAGDTALTAVDRIVRRIEASNRAYLEAYARNAKIMAVIEQVATFSPELLEMRRQLRVAYVDRSTRAIERWQAAGLADPQLEPNYAASALGSMVDRFAYVWLVLGGDFEFETSVATLTRLWVQALNLRDA